MNILCNKGDQKFVNMGDLDLPRGKHGYEGDWSKLREPPSKWVSVGSLYMFVITCPNHNRDSEIFHLLNLFIQSFITLYIDIKF